MKMNKLFLISTVCIIAVLSASASASSGIKINGEEYIVEIDGHLLHLLTESSKTPTPIPINACFVTCKNHDGNGFFWVDTSCGAVWWANPQETEWVSFGSPDSPQGRVGRYVPYENEGGEGLYILDTDQGYGWWTNGEQWKEMGMPQKKTSSTEG